MSLTVEQLTAIPRVQQTVPSPDGTWAATVVSRLDGTGSKYVTDLWRVPLDGKAPIRLTDGDTKDWGPAFRPDGGLYFLSNRPSPKDPEAKDDDSPTQIWLLGAGEVVPTVVTDEPQGVLGFVVARSADAILAMVPWLPGMDGPAQRKHLRERNKQGPSAKRYTAMPVRFWDHWLGDVVPHPVVYRNGGRVDLAPDVKDNRHDETSYAISPDGRLAGVTRKEIASDRIEQGIVDVHDLDAGKARARFAEPRAFVGDMTFSPNGESLAFVRATRTDDAPPPDVVVRWDLATDRKTDLGKGWDGWAQHVDWAADAIVVTADEQGNVPVFRIDPTSGSVTRVTDDGGSHDSVHAAPGGRIVGIRHTLFQPPTVFVRDAKGTRLLPIGAPAEDYAADVRREDLSVQSDGVAVQYRLLTPKGKGPHPTLFWIHGGPMGAFADGWHWRWNPLVFVSQGYAVVLPNPRGSTGFGFAYTAGVWGNTWGDGCYRDLMRVADALEARDDIGPMAAMGGSFGGYMSNWIGGNTTRFHCIVTHASIFSNWTFHGTTDHPAWWALEMQSTPYSDPENHDRYSPQRFVQNWKSPTLVVHGEKDYRCPISEGITLFEALQLHGVESELLVFPDEGHWIMRPKNIVSWYTAVAEFVGRYLR